MSRLAFSTSVGLTVIASFFITSGITSAQSPLIPEQSPARYYPLRHDMPPGKNARWAAMIKRPTAADVTFVKFELPSDGQVVIYGSIPAQPIPVPGWCGIGVGRLYRVRIAGLAEFPGVALYPTIEVLDHTSPPPGREKEFAVPIRLTIGEIEQALNGQMLTKVIYVEQPEIASPFPTEDGLVVETLTPDRNLLKAADRRGRPIAIFRLGARTPDPRRPDPRFFGSGGPVLVSRGPHVAPE